MPDVPNRRTRQADFARSLARLGQSHRREAERLLGDPPDVANIPQSFWDRVQAEIDDEISQHLLLLFLITIASLTRREANADLGRAYASLRGTDAAVRHVRFARDRLERASRIWRERAESELPIRQADIREKTLPVFGPARADQLATTLTTDAGTEGTRAAREELNREADDQDIDGVKLVWRLGPCNHCSLCPLLSGTDEEFFGQFFGGPPAHINCCCTLEFVPASRVTRAQSPQRVVRAARAIGAFGFERARF